MSETMAGSKATATGEAVSAPEKLAPVTPTIEDRARAVAESAGYVRNATKLTNEDATVIQHEAFEIELEAKTAKLAKQDPCVLLEELSEMGFAWRQIAEMLGVSVPALRKWRSGDRPTGENRRQVSQLLAFVQMLRDDHLVFEPASWMEVPLSRDAPITPVDLYAFGKLRVIHDLAAEKIGPEAALDAVDPEWRERYRTDWEIAAGEDGQPVIRPKPDR